MTYRLSLNDEQATYLLQKLAQIETGEHNNVSYQEYRARQGGRYVSLTTEDSAQKHLAICQSIIAKLTKPTIESRGCEQSIQPVQPPSSPANPGPTPRLSGKRVNVANKERDNGDHAKTKAAQEQPDNVPNGRAVRRRQRSDSSRNQVRAGVA